MAQSPWQSCRPVLGAMLVYDLVTCSGLPLHLVEASSSSSTLVIDFSIDLEAPLSCLSLMSPRLAASAAPAAFYSAADFAGTSVLLTVPSASRALRRLATCSALGDDIGEFGMSAGPVGHERAGGNDPPAGAAVRALAKALFACEPGGRI